MTVGVYSITNSINGKKYIGSTAISFESRWKTHAKKLRLGVHANRHLQAAWNKYGESSFTFEIVEIVDSQSTLLKREQAWIDSFNRESLYNLRENAASNLGMKVRGRKVSEEGCKLISAAHIKYCKEHPEYAKRISATKRGVTYEMQMGKERANALKATRGTISQKRAIERGPYILKSPTGFLIKTETIKELSKLSGLSLSSISRLFNGKRYSEKGWTVPEGWELA